MSASFVTVRYCSHPGRIIGQVYTYDSAKGIVAMSPTGHFFGFEEKCPVAP